MTRLSCEPIANFLGDAKLQQSGAKDVSPLVSINGTDAAEFLASYASGQSLQDRDAQYVLCISHALIPFF